MAVIPFNEETVFSVISNSTISMLSFNSEIKELTFNVTGPPDTFGYVDVYISKTLIPYVAGTTAYFDGNSIDYTTTSIEDSWLLHFTYPHSSHTVIIKLSETLSVFGLPIMDLAIIGIIIAVICVIAVVLVLRRKRMKK